MMRNRGRAAAGATAGMAGLALLLSACGSSGSNTNAGAAYSGSGMGASPSSSAMSGAGAAVTLSTKATSIGQVLTNAQGDTLYWYSKDTKDGPSTCTGSCASAWPMVAGQAVAGSGVKLAGELGTVTDAGGAMQATYNGYPLYTYAADKTPGQTTGNDEGGVWHVISGSALTAAAGMSSPSATKAVTSSGGYGYGSGTPITSSGSSSTTRASAAPAKATTAPAPAPTAPTTPAAAATTPAPGSTEGAGCGEGACW
jgi:predicted lipoprotein with Yx(FWY)xxD motif